MSKKRNDQKIPELEPKFKDVLVCRHSKDRPYIEIFTAEPENVFESNLGNIAGIFEIEGASEDASYIVNYLISIIKKEYFSHPKRGAVESFEAALHKANLALSKLASHGNVSWIGRLNAACIVSEKNNLHISNTGTASVLMMRGNSLSNISEGGEDSPEPNPIKTFEDVLSGRMEEGDKIIISTAAIFEIFSPEEIKKSALKFTNPEFVQFLNTALVNELERAAVLIIDVERKKEEAAPVFAKKHPEINAFSQAAFEKKLPSPAAARKSREEEKEIIEEIKEEYEKTRDGFVDKKTGHIYIKDENVEYDRKTSELEYVSASREKLAGTAGSLFSALGKIPGLVWDKIKFKKNPEPEKITVEPGSAGFYETPGTAPAGAEKETFQKPTFGEKFGPVFLGVIAWFKSAGIFLKNVLIYKAVLPICSGVKNIFSALVSKYKSRKIKIPVSASGMEPSQNQFGHQNREALWEKRTEYLSRSERTRNFSFVKSILPSFSKIKSILDGLSGRQKIYAFSALLAIIIVPYFIVRFTNQPDKIAAPVQPEEIVKAVPLENDKNVVRIESLNSIYEGKDILSEVNINGKNFAVTGSEIVSPEDSKNYSLPQEYNNADLISQMDDLNFIFIIKNEQITSFSTVAGKFQNNNISIPDAAGVVSAKSYLTYLYILDAKNNQIYRYPRAEGGFGEKTNWIKEAAELSGAKDMAINENIYVADGEKISKFFQGKKQDYSTEETATPIVAEKLYTKPDWENLYVLDKANSRIIKLDKDGKITAQYYNDEIKNANGFAVDEEKSVIYISSESNVKSFGI